MSNYIDIAEQVASTFSDIKDAIIEKGVDVGECDSPMTYPDKVRAIPTGADHECLVKSVNGMTGDVVVEMPNLDDYALKSELPNMEDYARKDELPDGVDLSEYAKKSELPEVPTKVSELENDIPYVTQQYVDDAIAAIDCSGECEPYDDSALKNRVKALEDTNFVEGPLKTINGESIIGEGNIIITGGSGAGVDGKDGKDGVDGQDGKSAYELWLELPGNANKTIEDFFAALKGADGKDGVDGKDGADGTGTGTPGEKGADGKSAYELWKEIEGNENKTLDDFFASLKGEKGEDGAPGSGSDYTLPIASETVLGGIKVGDGLAINDGVLSVIGGGSGSGSGSGTPGTGGGETAITVESRDWWYTAAAEDADLDYPECENYEESCMNTNGWYLGGITLTSKNDTLWGFERIVYSDGSVYISPIIAIRKRTPISDMMQEDYDKLVSDVKDQISTDLEDAVSRLDAAEEKLNNLPNDIQSKFEELTGYIETDEDGNEVRRTYADIVADSKLGKVALASATRTEEGLTSVESSINSLNGTISDYADFKSSTNDQINTVKSTLNAHDASIEQAATKAEVGEVSTEISRVSQELNASEARLTQSVAKAQYSWVKYDTDGNVVDILPYAGEESKEGYTLESVVEAMSAINMTPSKIELMVGEELGKVAGIAIVAGEDGNSTIQLDADYLILNGKAEFTAMMGEYLESETAVFANGTIKNATIESATFGTDGVFKINADGSIGTDSWGIDKDGNTYGLVLTSGDSFNIEFGDPGNAGVANTLYIVF